MQKNKQEDEESLMQEASVLAKEALLKRGIRDPRLVSRKSSVELYDAIREYDSLCANEVLKFMRAPPHIELVVHAVWLEDWRSRAYG